MLALLGLIAWLFRKKPPAAPPAGPPQVPPSPPGAGASSDQSGAAAVG
jgi:hypothetical protein